MPDNPNCCGGYCRSETSEVRVYRLGAPGTMNGNLILCQACWAHENRYRYNRDPSGKDWPQQDWYTAEVYNG